MKQRIIAKRDRDKWGVYDTIRGSWPGSLTGFGKVKQHLADQSEAEAEAQRLEEFYTVRRTSP